MSAAWSIPAASARPTAGGGQENYCRPGFKATYNSPDKHTDPPTFGGYPSHVVADMSLKLAHAMGAKVTLFTTSPGKEDDARRLGADNVVISKD